MYLLFALPTVNAPLTYDEIYWPFAAQSLNKIGRAVNFAGGEATWSPSLYVNVQSLFYRIFGVSNWSSRLIGIFCLSFQLFCIFFLGKKLFAQKTNGWKLALLGAIFFVTNPAVIQGSLLPYDDTTFLPLFLILFGYAFITDKGDLKKTSLLILLFFLALWSKLTTPVVAILSMFLYYFLNKNYKRAILETVLVSITGAFLFLVTWWIYCRLRNINFLDPINYALSTFISYNILFRRFIPATRPGIFDFILTVTRFFLWVGPFFIFVVSIGVIQSIFNYTKRAVLQPIDFLNIYAILIGVGYAFIGGASFGFPKYHYPMFGAISLLAASTVTVGEVIKKMSKKDFLIIATLVMMVTIFYAVFVGDLIYLLNFSLREASVLTPPRLKNVLIYFIYKCGLYFLPFVVIFSLVKTFKKNYRLVEVVILTLIILTLSSNLSLNFIQVKAKYLVRYCYGAEGTEELINFLDKNVSPGEIVLAPNDIIYYLNLKNKELPFTTVLFWYNTKEVVRRVKSSKTKFVIYSVTHNDLRQFKTAFSNREFLLNLQNDFIFQKIGTYFVYTRK